MLFYLLYITNKAECFSFQSGYVILVAKYSKQTGLYFVVIIYDQNNFAQLLKSFVDNVLKCKRSLKFKCVCVSMHSSVISIYSRDFLKTQLFLTEVFISFVIACMHALLTLHLVFRW